MNNRIAMNLILPLTIALVAVCGCAKGVQDEGEIPATIGQVEDAGELTQEIDTNLQTQAAATEAPQADQAKQQDLITLLKKENEEFEKQTIDIPKTWKRLGKNHIWADQKNKQVIVRGAICLNVGLLEMFVCPRQTKEHEAIISAHAPASEVHATLLAMEVEPGHPMIWNEEYYPVSGPVMNIEIWWNDENGKLVKRRAQEMIRNTDTGKAMTCDFVYGGSESVFDPYEKTNNFMADYGPMINVANQPDAMIDVSIQSSAEAQGSLFEAFTENVPPVNTKVYIVLSPSGKVIKSKAPKKKRTIAPSKENSEPTPEAKAADATDKQ